ncbi:MAG: cell division protein FtsQ/DivIB [Gammaproteobacteria bacterium]
MGTDEQYISMPTGFTPTAAKRTASRRLETEAVDIDAAEADANNTSRSFLIGGVLSLLLLLGLIAAALHLLQPQTLPIKQVRIEGEFRHLSQADIQQLVSRKIRGGFFSVDVAALRDAVAAEPWVRDVQVQRVWSDALQVSIREQLPLARWADSGLVNADGDYFQPQQVAQLENLPQLNGPDNTQAQMTQHLLQLQQALAPLGIEIAELELTERRAWSFITRTGLQVVLGREAFNQRLQRFVTLVSENLGDQLNRAVYVDMRYPNGFAVRFNKAARATAQGDGAV